MYIIYSDKYANALSSSSSFPLYFIASRLFLIYLFLHMLLHTLHSSISINLISTRICSTCSRRLSLLSYMTAHDHQPLDVNNLQ